VDLDSTTNASDPQHSQVPHQKIGFLGSQKVTALSSLEPPAYLTLGIILETIVIRLTIIVNLMRR
jgi:hypothetical protein